MEKVIEILKKNKEEIKNRFGVRKIGVFGSFSRGEGGKLSDIDIIVDFETPPGWEIVDLHEFLEQIFNRKVDLLTERGVKRKPSLWNSIKKDIIYV